MTIPKIIHYCWFGNNKLGDFQNFCINSWQKFCPDYKLKLWNEESFNINSNQYVKEAYESKKFAFVTDYVRLYALYNYGGIYMDTDVEVIKNLDDLLQQKGFSGFESSGLIPTGIMASEKNHKFIKELLERYKNRNFIIDGKMDLTTNVIDITEVATNHGLILNGTEQDICNYKFYPKDYFCPKSWTSDEIQITNNTYTIHHFNGSWMTKTNKVKRNILKILTKTLGENKVNKIINMIKNNNED